MDALEGEKNKLRHVQLTPKEAL